MTFTVRTEYRGDLRQQNTHLASGQSLLTDGPQAAGGKGELMAPTDVLAAALASCAMTIMALKAAAAGADFSGCYAESGKDVAMEDFRVSRIHIIFHLKAAFAPELRRELEAASREMCIVGRSLHPDLAQKFEFIYSEN